jgi:hypothetical protein
MISDGTPHPKRPFLPCSSMVEDDITNEEALDLQTRQSLRRNSSDPNLTLISVFSPNTSLPNVEVNVQRASASATSTKSSHTFSLFKLPDRRNSSIPTSNAQLLQTIDGVRSTDNTVKNETRVEALNKPKQERRNRFISFVRYIFCQFVSIGSNATVTPAVDDQTIISTTNNNSSIDSNQVSPIHTTVQIENQPKVKQS